MMGRDRRCHTSRLHSRIMELDKRIDAVELNTANAMY